jgi:hypothetical protein
MSIRQFPRLITEVIRGTYRYRKLKALLPASERTNSTAKDDLCILSKPKVRGLRRAGVLGQMAVIVVLLKRITRFIVRVTLVLWGINSVTYFQAANFCSSSNLDSNSFRSSRVNFHSNGLETCSYAL